MEINLTSEIFYRGEGKGMSLIIHRLNIFSEILNEKTSFPVLPTPLSPTTNKRQNINEQTKKNRGGGV